MSDIKTVCVYLGSSNKVSDVFKNDTRSLGEELGKNGIDLVYGGMADGPMGIIARSVLEHGGHVTGVLPEKIEDSNRILQNLPETIYVKDLWQRKLDMFKRADAYVAMPGGYGTIDEVTEVLHWLNEGLHNKPVVLVNTDGYWDDFIGFMQAATDEGYYPEHLWANILVVEDSTKVVAALDNWQAPPRVIDENRIFPHLEGEILNPAAAESPVVITGPTPENMYRLSNALVFKQLDKHHRPVAVLDEDHIYDGFLKWVEKANAESFITDKCARYPLVGNSSAELRTLIDGHSHEVVDLDNEKWGQRDASNDNNAANNNDVTAHKKGPHRNGGPS